MERIAKIFQCSQSSITRCNAEHGDYSVEYFSLKEKPTSFFSICILNEVQVSLEELGPVQKLLAGKYVVLVQVKGKINRSIRPVSFENPKRAVSSALMKSKMIFGTKTAPNFSIGERFIKKMRVQMKPHKLSTYCQILGCFNNEFIVVSENGQLVLIDQHAADERIRLENLTSTLHLMKKCMHPELTFEDEKLERIGFVENRFPSVFETMSTKIFKAAVDEMMDPACSLPIGHLFLDHLKMIACRGAIKFGDHLTESQIERLIGSLLKCQYPNICAHGRPSMLKILRKE